MALETDPKRPAKLSGYCALFVCSINRSKVIKIIRQIYENTSVRASMIRHFLTPDQNRENYDSKVVQVVLTRS